MSMVWTTEKVLALSPDASSTKSGQQLSRPNHWVTLGQSPAVLWGECQGSGKTPYRTQIDLSEPAFKCSCPSRKFPCKHSLGLFLLFADQPDQLTAATPPDWVQEWLDKRSQTVQKKQEISATKAIDPAAQAERMAKREAKVTAGLADLERWLRDSLRQGLAALQTQPYSYWDGTAARLVDAQAPALAKRVREMAGLPQSGAGWPERLLAAFGTLYTIVQGYQRLTTLPVAVQAELRSQIGWTLKQDELLGLANDLDSTVETCRDRWWVLGRRVFEEDTLQVQRIWLQGMATQRSALLLNFAHRSQVLECSVWSGTCFQGELIFYPGLYPLRAVIKSREAEEIPWTDVGLKGGSDLQGAIANYGLAIAQNPWLETFPMLLNDVVPIVQEESCELADQGGYVLPLDSAFNKSWSLMALSGGHPIQVFGEWNGFTLMPLSIGVEGRWIQVEAL